jgi:hypothetical protein
MPCDLFWEVGAAVADMMREKSGEDSGRAAVDREMRRLLGDLT